MNTWVSSSASCRTTGATWCEIDLYHLSSIDQVKRADFAIRPECFQRTSACWSCRALYPSLRIAWNELLNLKVTIGLLRPTHPSVSLRTSTCVDHHNSCRQGNHIEISRIAILLASDCIMPGITSGAGLSQTKLNFSHRRLPLF